ncbi:hypothetical protein POTOM_054544 [Populus tomentosa]|uniref:Uncharacterized protein n=1 Tax=Populus tomentosa TaxID=118781 RepID=A0A8X7XZ10_POPTO|nr:hypothetical protein POTOM_054544 [Populus tomentosa]
MENGARVIKGFILSIPQSMSRLWHRAGQLESQQLPPPTMNQEEDLVDNSMMSSVCICSSLQGLHLQILECGSESHRLSILQIFGCNCMYSRIEESEVLLSRLFLSKQVKC